MIDPLTYYWLWAFERSFFCAGARSFSDQLEPSYARRAHRKQSKSAWFWVTFPPAEEDHGRLEEDFFRKKRGVGVVHFRLLEGALRLKLPDGPSIRRPFPAAVRAARVPQPGGEPKALQCCRVAGSPSELGSRCSTGVNGPTILVVFGVTVRAGLFGMGPKLHFTTAASTYVFVVFSFSMSDWHQFSKFSPSLPPPPTDRLHR